MFTNSSHNNSTVQPLTLFGQSQASTPFSMHSAPRSIFGSSINTSNNYANPLISTSINGSSLFGSTHNNIFSNSPRVGMFTTNSLTPTSNIFSNNMTTSSIFSNASKQSSLGFPSQSPSGNIFQQSTMYSNSTGPGTPIPFRAVQSSDSVMKGGTQLNVQVRLECIPAMKEYENKSLEELRFEDYLAGRKGISNAGFQSQTTVQPGLFSSLAANNSSGKGIFSSINNVAYPNNQHSTQTSGIFSTKSQVPLVLGQSSQGNKSISNQPSSGLFGTIGHTSNSSLFPQQVSNQFSNLLPNVGSNLSYNSQTNLPTSMFSTQNNSHLLGSKPIIGNYNPQAGYNFGQSFTPLLGKPTSLPGQSIHVSNGTLISNPQTAQLGGFSTKPFDLALSKASTTFIGDNSLINCNNSSVYSAQHDPSNYSCINSIDPPQNLEKQLLLLARIPFGDSPLFKDAKETVESLVLKEHQHRQSEMGVGSSDTARKSAPPGKIFKMKVQSSNIYENNNDIDNSVYFHRYENPSDIIFTDPKDVLVARKSSVKNLEIPLVSSDSLPIDTSMHFPKAQSSFRTVESNFNDQSSKPSQLLALDEIPPQDSNVVNIDNYIVPDIQKTTIRNLESALIDDDHIRHELLSLTRSDYSTSPPCVEIIKLLNAKLQLIITEFTVIRRNFGQIQFQGLTNITGLNLDEIVFIGNKEVTVYPTESLKPIFGTGLNREAIISLKEVWPIDKFTRKAIRDSAKILSSRYYEKVEKCTEKLGAQFIDYDIQNGVWKFSVEHFSNYKLIISDSSDGEDNDLSYTNVEQEIVNIPSVAKSHFTIKKSLDVIHTVELVDENTLSDVTETTPTVPIFSQNLILRNLFFTNSVGTSNYGAHQIFHPSIAQTILSPYTYNSPFDSVYHDKMQNFNFPKTTSISSISPILAEESIILFRNSFIADTTSIFNRNFRPSWSKNGILALTFPSCSNCSRFFSVGLFRFRPHESHHISTFVTFLNSLLKILVDSSKIDFIKPVMGNNRDIFCDLLKSNFCANIFDNHSINHLSGYSMHIWTLLMTILSRNGDVLPLSSGSYPFSIESIERFNVWLSEIDVKFKNVLISNASEHYLFDILSELTKGNVDQASTIAMLNSDYHLALSISQGINDPKSRFKTEVQSQVHSWKSWSNSEYISSIRIFIYGIISGNFNSIFVDPFLDIFFSLNWLQSLLLLIYFSEAPNFPSIAPFVSYKNFVLKNCLPAPFPPHHDELISSRKGSLDVYYRLISKSYLNDIPLSSVLSVAGYSSSLLDYAFSFKMLFTPLGSEALDLSRSILRSHITMNFANQVAFSGFWYLSIFILLFLPPSTHKISAINAVVEQECTGTHSLSKQEIFVKEILSFDNTKLFYFKSNLALYLHKFDQYFQLLIEANESSLAHRIILTRFVFPYVIDEELLPLKEKLRRVEYHGRTNQIQSWEFEGSIYLDYIRIFETIQKLLEGNSCSAFELDDLLFGVRSLCTRISFLKCEFYEIEEYLAINEISKNLVLFLKIITAIQKHGKPYDTFSNQTLPYFTKLPLITDNFTVVSNEMCDRYLLDIDNF